MTILHRHMLKEILLAAAMVTGGFLFVMIAGNLLRGPLGDVLSGKLAWGTFAELLLLLIPGVAPYVLPIGILTGVLLVLGRMSAQNEITAMKASGMSLWRIASPIVAVGLAGTLAAVFVNFQYAPWANDRTKAILTNTIRERPADMIVEKTPVADFPGLLIYADRREGSSLYDVWIWKREKLDSGGFGRDTDFIRAKRAEITTVIAASGKAAEDTLRVKLTDAVVEHRESADTKEVPESVAIANLAETEMEIPLGKLLGRATSYDRKLRWLTLPELLEARDKGFDTKPGDPAKARFADRIKVQTQIQSNLAGAFGILSLTMLAIPLGIRVSRSETFVNFALALLLALGYYLLTVFMTWIHNPNLRPDILVWLPNIAIQAVAVRLFLRAART